MQISARVVNSESAHMVEVTTDGRTQALSIAPKSPGRGSTVNGGELLFAALATCFCNDLYREAERRTIKIEGVEVEVTGQFGGRGEPARDVSYRVQVGSAAPASEIEELVRATDAVAEIQNTLRAGCTVRLVR
jgi:uncharacterized OsmC-like protein